MTADRLRIEAELTAAGAEFEVDREPVLGHPTKVYRNRLRSLREMADSPPDPSRLHVVYGERRLSFRDVGRAANSVSRALRSAGVRPGDRVAVLSANSPEWIATFWGTVNIGAVLVGLNGWWSADEAVHGLRDCGARVLVADEPRYRRVRQRLPDCPDLERVYVVGAGAGDNVTPFAELTADPSDELPVVLIAEDDPAVILYTSGTTGLPRGAVHSHRGIIANAQNMRFNAMLGARLAGLVSPATSTALLTVPFFHVSGCHAGFVAAMARGSTVVIPTGRFDPEETLALIERERVTQWSTVPTMVARVVDHTPSRSYDLSSLAALAYGGAPSGAELQRRARATFPGLRGLHTGYGLTETCGAVTINSGAELQAHPAAAGRPSPVVELRVDPPPTGEVQVRTSQRMLGYWPLGTDDAFTPDGWLRTGDIGHLDEDGRLHITDRAKDVVIRGGENVFCPEIENRLAEHPAVSEAAVVGIPHPTLGEEVCAFVTTRPGREVGAVELQEWVAATLARFKVPSLLRIGPEPLPRNAAGKPLKPELRRRMLTRDSSAEHVGQLRPALDPELLVDAVQLPLDRPHR